MKDYEAETLHEKSLGWQFRPKLVYFGMAPHLSENAKRGRGRGDSN